LVNLSGFRWKKIVNIWRKFLIKLEELLVKSISRLFLKGNSLSLHQRDSQINFDFDREIKKSSIDSQVKTYFIKIIESSIKPQRWKSTDYLIEAKICPIMNYKNLTVPS
jgi:hypothetical protein